MRRTMIVFALLIVTLVIVPAFYTATPASGTVSESSPLVTWTGPVKPATGSSSCGGPNNASCDNYKLNIIPPSAAFGAYVVEIKLQPAAVGDWDLQVYGPDGALINSSGNSPGQLEMVTLSNPPAGTYTVSGSPFAPAVGPDTNSYNASAEMKKQTVVNPPPGTEPVTYANYPAPDSLGRSAGEPSIGVNWKTDKVFIEAGLETLRVSFDNCSSPAKATWEDKSAPTSVTSLDPILFTDSRTGRTFVSQLTGQDSLSSFTDDDGDTWIPSQGGGIPSGVDHQTLASGRFHDPLTRDPNGTLYPNAVYYCSQDVATAFCARSDNGGVTYGPGVPIYNLTECGGIHGHVKVAPNDGTVYVPNKGCNGIQSVIVSEDNGITWSVRKVQMTGAAANSGSWDPSVAIATDGTVYFGWDDGDGHPGVAVSHDKGVTWTNFRNVGSGVVFGSQVGIKQTAFPAIVAGDPMRAAFAFLGSTEPTPGGSGDNPNWPGQWHLYVAHTYDGGLTWTTVDATPNDPVQRGTICNGGFGGCDNGTRNLLDFMDATIDREGRVLVGYADGCTGDCAKNPPNSFSDLATIARQVNGKRMFAQFDQVTVPAAPLLTAACDPANSALIHLSWSAPDDHGSPISGYKIYRRPSSGAFSLLATVGAAVRTYNDTITPSQTFFYKVTAVNALGEGPACGEVSSVCSGPPTTDPCTPPGETVVTDPSGDASIGSPTQLDIQSVALAGLLSDGTPRLVVTLKVSNMNSVPANSSWRTIWTFNGVNYFVAMNNCNISGVTFTYGTFVSPSFTTVGNADAGQFSADGSIQITIAASKVGSPVAGQTLTAINARTQTFIGAECSGLLLTQDSTGNGSFLLRSCVSGTPDARDDAASTIENNPVIIDVLANDSDPNGDPLMVVAVTQGANGSVTNNGNGTVTYRPNVSFVGNDSFTYTISDPGGLMDTATVRVTVNPFCQPSPTGSFSDTFEPSAKPGWGVDTATNNLGPASPAWQVTTDANAQSPTHSFFSDASTLDVKDDRLVAPTQALSSTSQLTFWHRFNFEDTFDGGVLEVSRDGGATWVDVLSGGGSFAEGGYNGTISANFGSPIAGRQAWTGGATNAAASAMTKVVVNLGAFAGPEVRVRFRLACDPLAAGSLPGQGWWIDDVQFTNTLVAGTCNRPPIANDDSASTVQNTPVTINVLANDSDPDGDTLTVQSVTQPAHGSAVNNGNGTVTYTPSSGFLGADSFNYVVSDGHGNSSTAKVSVTVTAAPNRPPHAVSDSATTTKNTAVTINVLANDTDPDNDPLSVQGVTQPAHGAATNNTGSVTYTPSTGFVGTDSFTYTVSDGRGGTDTGTVTVTVTEAPNRPPDAVNDSAATEQNMPVTINVLANDTDPDGDTLMVTGVTQPAHGSAVNNGNGTVTYTPNPDFSGTDSFNYAISDGRGGVDTATVTVTVQPAPSGGKVTGGGWIPGSGSNEKNNFGFNAQVKDGAKGRLTYDANNGGVSLKGTIDSLHVSGSQADFSGVGTLRDGTAVRFTVHAEDRAEPGTGVDRFSIQIFNMAGGQIYQAGGVLGGGNIQIH